MVFLFLAGSVIGFYNIWMTIRQAPDAGLETVAGDPADTPVLEAGE